MPLGAIWDAAYHYAHTCCMTTHSHMEIQFTNTAKWSIPLVMGAYYKTRSLYSTDNDVLALSVHQTISNQPARARTWQSDDIIIPDLDL